jgi:acetyl esterase/lipase
VLCVTALLATSACAGRQAAPPAPRAGAAAAPPAALAVGGPDEAAATPTAPPGPPPHDTFERLWPGPAPEAKGETPADEPGLTIHLPPPERATGAAVIVNPGGGYFVLAADHEGLQVARWLNRQGIAAFVLRYRLRPSYAPEVAFLDAQRAMRHVRHHAARFNVAPDRIGMMGFSAGGNLASWVGTQGDDGQAGAADPVERASARPDFLLLVYPAISHKVSKDRYGASTEDLVTARTPPTFLVHTHEDGLTANHSVAFYQALLAQKVPAEMHVFGFGPHGTGLAPGDPDLGRWRALAAGWLRRSGFLTGKGRVAVAGQVRVDGQPMPWGWVTLLPEDERCPIATAYLGKPGGRFAFDERNGPCPGRHRVELHIVSGAGADMKIGKTSLADAYVLRRPAPGAAAPIVIDVSRGAPPVAIDVQSR